MPGNGWNAHLEEREPERRVTISASSGSKRGGGHSNAQCAESQQSSPHTGPLPATSVQGALNHLGLLWLRLFPQLLCNF